MKRDIKKLRFLQSEANGPKHELIRIMDRLEIASPKDAESLGKIIAKLEAWQNKK